MPVTGEELAVAIIDSLAGEYPTERDVVLAALESKSIVFIANALQDATISLGVRPSRITNCYQTNEIRKKSHRRVPTCLMLWIPG